MKRLIGIGLVIGIVFGLACGKNEPPAADSAKTPAGQTAPADSSTAPAAEAKKEKTYTVVTIAMPEGGIVLEKGSAMYDRQFDQTMISAKNETLSFTLEFKGKTTGEKLEVAGLTIPGYEDKDAVVNVTKYTTKKSAYGGLILDSIEGSFTVTLRKLGANRFPEGDPITVTGTFKQ